MEMAEAPPAALYGLLHPEGAAVGELLASGVGLSRVLGLYPAPVEDYMKQLDKALSAAAARKLITEREGFNLATATFYNALLSHNSELAEDWSVAHDRYQDSGRGVELWHRLSGLWLQPEGVQDPRAVRATIENLFDVCWLMAHWLTLSGVNGAEGVFAHGCRRTLIKVMRRVREDVAPLLLERADG